MCSSLFVLCVVFSLCYVQLLVFVMRSVSQCYVQFLVYVMCSVQFVLCAVFILFYVHFAVTTFVASRRACLASLGRAYACVHVFEAAQDENWCADLLGRTFVEATDEIPPHAYIYICMCIHIHVLIFI